MIRVHLFVVGLIVALALFSACGMGNGNNEQYLDLFEQYWSEAQQGQLFNLDVASVSDGPNGWKQVTINFSHGIGENYPSQENQAAMLVSPDHKSIKKCVYNLSSGACFSGVQPDWAYRP